ncbi:MAG: hypothetical protein O2973_10535 [Gemmatimonadetes bacterium]|nr:hypothetical protein [Gemmatimonadota bacterium]
MSLTSMLRRIPGLRGLIDMRREVLAMRWDILAIRKATQDQLGAMAAAYVDDLLQQPCYADPRHLARAELRIHSQNGEDGIIAEIFRRIGTTSRTFVEIGVESGVETNTTLLLRQGWRGYWIEGRPELAAMAQANFAAEVASGQLTIIEAMVTSDNAAALLREAGVPTEVDLLSVDIDRNTWHVWRALGDLRARASVIEYNASFGPQMDWVIDDAPSLSWNNTVNFGASLSAYDRLGRERGLSLVGCTLNGSNAFFVESPLATAHFVGPFTSEALWEPPRYWLRWRDGHPTGPLR